MSPPESRIDEACDRFEAEWRAGRRPRMEVDLDGFPEPERAELFRELLRLELELCREGGGEPMRDEYERRFPEYIGLIAAAFHEGETDPSHFSTRVPGREGGACDLGPQPPTMPRPSIPFRVLRFLGAGTFGEVWLAEDLNLLRLVALKTLKFRSDLDARAAALATLRNEARRLIEVCHPNIVQVYAWLQDGQDPYLVLQYVAGGSLSDRLKREGPLGWQHAARYIADVAEGLLEVHARGIIHRDIKPANILWGPEKDEALLTDFGVSVRLADAGPPAGTLSYMAPEALDGQMAQALDVYSLAATLFHLVTGTVPFPGPGIPDLRRQIAQGLSEPDPRCRALPEPLERVIRAGLAASSERRPGLREFVTTLRGTLNQLLADALVLAPEEARPPVPVDLRLSISRAVDRDIYRPAAATSPRSGGMKRDMKQVPRPPEQVRLRTGDRVRIEAIADRAGYVTVFNIGPGGNLNLLTPDAGSLATPPPPVEAHRPLHIPDVELTPPAGHERLIAVWSRRPLALSPEQLRGLADRGASPGSRPYQATRDMRRMGESMRQLPPDDWRAVVLDLNHLP
jgi:serine/threonine protein kinase